MLRQKKFAAPQVLELFFLLQILYVCTCSMPFLDLLLFFPWVWVSATNAKFQVFRSNFYVLRRSTAICQIKLSHQIFARQRKKITKIGSVRYKTFWARINVSFHKISYARHESKYMSAGRAVKKCYFPTWKFLFEL